MNFCGMKDSEIRGLIEEGEACIREGRGDEFILEYIRAAKEILSKRRTLLEYEEISALASVNN